MVAAPDGLEAYIEQIRASRAEFRESVAAVRASLDGAGPAGPLPRQRVRTALVELARDWAGHVALSEDNDGLFMAVRDVPRLIRTLERLDGEHPALTADLQDFVDLLDGDDGATDVPAFRDELLRLVDRLVDHRRRGGDLLYEAVAVDLGGQD
jgi:hypothetical protein